MHRLRYNDTITGSNRTRVIVERRRGKQRANNHAGARMHYGCIKDQNVHLRTDNKDALGHEWAASHCHRRRTCPPTQRAERWVGDRALPERGWFERGYSVLPHLGDTQPGPTNSQLAQAVRSDKSQQRDDVDHETELLGRAHEVARVSMA